MTAKILFKSPQIEEGAHQKQNGRRKEEVRIITDIKEILSIHRDSTREQIVDQMPQVPKRKDRI